MPNPNTVSRALIVVGNGNLSGRTKDTNSPYIAAVPNQTSIRMAEARVEGHG